MKIFSASQIKAWDAYTIVNEPVKSIQLMERAATSCFNWLVENNFTGPELYVFCGRGNNGADGLAIARLLLQQKYKVKTFILEAENKATPDFETNLERLSTETLHINFISTPGNFPLIPAGTVLIDALYGTGLNKPLTNNNELLVNYLNYSGAPIISIDIPSGLYADQSSVGNAIICAAHTLSFQQYKLAFLLAENENYCGNVHILDIALHAQFEQDEWATYTLTDKKLVQSFYKHRKKFTHKGTYGHAALIAGSYGMMGTAVLSAGACLRSGTGKLSCYIPQCGYQIIQTTVPEAMCRVNGEDHLVAAEAMETFDAIGIGPGIGRYPSHNNLLKQIFSATNKPVVIDADALNIIAAEIGLLNSVPPESVLTPHPKEFERLFGKTANDFERLQLALQKSKEYTIYIVLKGNFSFISTPQGVGFFNSTGNAGMATAGSGDVLTGIITGLLAQGYPAQEACILGVYLHGSAGDFAADMYSMEAMIAGDINTCLGKAFKAIG
ncbi:MAG: NAD(P)H-hydrate dehydratase [Ferruginibacter sp.]